MTSALFTQPALGFSSSQAASSRDDRELTHAPSTDSMTSSFDSYESTRDISRFIREIGGRWYNAQNEAYFLPSDGFEWGRLDKMHMAILLGLNGHIYPIPDTICAVLQSRPDNTTRILDIGCGTGLWVVEMARMFPHAEVVGVDLAPIPMDSDQAPDNCRFEIDDVNGGLRHFYDQFDLVHCRCILSGIRDFSQTLTEMEKCLKPGGILIAVGGDGTIYDEDRDHPLPMGTEATPDGSWFRRICYEAYEAGNAGGGDIRRGAELIDLGFWDHPLIDPETCGIGSLYLPIGSWIRLDETPENVVENQRLQYAGSLTRQNLLRIHRAYHRVLGKVGFSEETLNEWSARIDDEIINRKFKMWTRHHFAWGRRRTAPDEPAPQLPLPGENSAQEGNGLPLYPFFVVRESQAEALNDLQRRRLRLEEANQPIPQSTFHYASLEENRNRETTE